MKNIINVNFKNDKSEQKTLKYFNSFWFKSLSKRCEDPNFWSYHLKFKVYETDKNFAVIFSFGVGSQFEETPSRYYNDTISYNKDINKLWKSIFKKLERYNVDTSLVKKEINKALIRFN